MTLAAGPGQRPPPPPPWARSLVSVGVTGTNGKTSTTWMLASLLRHLHGPTVCTSTLGTYLDGERLDLPMDYRGFLAGMRRCLDTGGRHAVLELTSESLANGFAKAWPCQIGVFTNLSPDHQNYHQSFEHYLASKAQLFMHLPQEGVAVLNADDPSTELLQSILPEGVRPILYGRSERCDVQVTNVDVSWTGTTFELVSGGASRCARIPAIGEIFALNAAAAFAAAVSCGLAPDVASAELSDVRTPPGRFERVRTRPFVVVDYAHTPDALSRTMQTAQVLTGRCGEIHVVLGAGGDRDRAKRPKMGRAVASADHVWLTADNPRSEDPRAIADEIRAGLAQHRSVHVELDRRHAIRRAIAAAGDDDLVLIAGKGHEQRQEIRGEVRPFSDAQEARLAPR